MKKAVAIVKKKATITQLYKNKVLHLSHISFSLEGQKILFSCNRCGAGTWTTAYSVKEERFTGTFF